MARGSFAVIIFLTICCASYGQKPDFKVLAFYGRDTDDIRTFFSNLGDQENFTFDATKDWTNLNDTLLKNYQVVMWINDAPRTKAQVDSFRKFMENGGGWVGFGNVWRGKGYETFKGERPYEVVMTSLEDRLVVKVDHPITQNIPASLSLYGSDLSENNLPVVWTNEKYKVVYLNLAHNSNALADYFRKVLYGDALLWVGKKSIPKRKATSANNNFPEMISVKGGTFTMGDDAGDKDEKPAHQVTVADFNIAKTETTMAQWRNFCLATGRAMPETPWFPQSEQHPVVNVSWDHAIAYCKWLSDVTGKHYRLPTEAEWEFAARGGVKSKGFPYSGGKNADSVAWLGRKTEGTMPVAQKAPNELGLHDMTGNVWEWCSDWYDAGYYAVSERENPKGPASGKFYTFRGGAWDIGVRNNRITYRNPLAPTSRNHNKGFRVACD